VVSVSSVNGLAAFGNEAYSAAKAGCELDHRADPGCGRGHHGRPQRLIQAIFGEGYYGNAGGPTA
jgi:hypothetical protein